MAATFRDIKLKARATVHSRMKVAALYFSDGLFTSTPIPVNVRVRYKFGVTGEDQGTRLHYAQVQDEYPAILFMIAEVPAPRNNAVVMISSSEGYRINNVMPPDLVSILAQCVPLDAADVATYDYPGDTNWPMTTWSS